MAAHHWRWYFDVFVLSVYVPLVLVGYFVVFRYRHSEVMRVRQPHLYLMQGMSGISNIVCVFVQDLFLLSGSGEFPCALLMFTSMQTMPFSPFLGAILIWQLVYAFHPEKKATAPRWLIQPRKYWGVMVGFLLALAVPFTAFYFSFARWRPQMQRERPGEFGVCFMYHEYW
jgi:hypothetical protein